MQDEFKISHYDLFISLIISIVGIKSFSYPREMADLVGTDGWFVTIISAIIIYLIVFVICKTIKLNAYCDFSTILKNNLGKILGTVVGICFVVFELFSISINMRTFTEELKMYLLEKTPTELILVVIIVTGVYLVISGVDALIRFNEISFFIMFIPFLIFLLFTLNNADFTNVLPMFNNKPSTYLISSGKSLYMFQGYEILFLLIPILNKKNKVEKTVLKGIIFIAIFYILVTVFSLAIFSVRESKVLLWPTITMIKALEIEGSFVERWDGLMMALWVLFFYTTFTNIYYFAADTLKKILKLKDVKIICLITAPLIYFTALYPSNIAVVYQIITTIIPVYSAIFIIVLPTTLYIISLIKKNAGGGV
jgi:spore germination protein (amino acid permease)